MDILYFVKYMLTKSPLENKILLPIYKVCFPFQKGYDLLNNVKAVRYSLGVKQAEICDLLGITRVSYSNKENKKTPFTDKEKILLKKFLSDKAGKDFSIDYLFF